MTPAERETKVIDAMREIGSPCTMIALGQATGMDLSTISVALNVLRKSEVVARDLNPEYRSGYRGGQFIWRLT